MFVAAISDILDRLEIRDRITPTVQSIVKFSGRAKTILLEEIETDNENMDIGLKFLESLTSNDVLLVKGSEKFAYFGELMTRFSVRQGIKGVVIDGKTRDSHYTRHSKLPIVATQGYSPIDIKKRGRVKATNVPISIDGVKICPDDFVVVDSDGLAVIHQDEFPNVLNEYKKELCKEDDIVNYINAGKTVNELLDRFDSF